MTTKPFEGEAESISIQVGRAISYCRPFLFQLYWYFSTSLIRVSLSVALSQIKKKVPTERTLRGRGFLRLTNPGHGLSLGGKARQELEASSHRHSQEQRENGCWCVHCAQLTPSPGFPNPGMVLQWARSSHINIINAAPPQACPCANLT